MRVYGRKQQSWSHKRAADSPPHNSRQQSVVLTNLQFTYRIRQITMARGCIVLFFVSFIIACDFSNGFLIRGKNLEPVFTKETPAPQDGLAMEDVPAPQDALALQDAPAPQDALALLNAPAPQDALALQEAPALQVAPVPQNTVEEVGPEPAPVEVLVTKQCAKIGEFCMNHSDCCTNACLGYMKRCVS